jgi:hypothetical protein
LLNWIAKEYNNPPVVVTENGFSDHGDLKDRDRIDYLIVSGNNSAVISMGIKMFVSELIHIYSHQILSVYRERPSFVLLFCFSIDIL